MGVSEIGPVAGTPHPIRLASPSETIRNSYPDGQLFEWLALAITELGEDPAIILVLAFAYWVIEREKIAVLASFVVVGVGLTLFVKSAFAMPRPPEEVWLIARDYDPYGFPSGHAINAVLIYGGFVYLFDRVREYRALAVSVFLIVSIGLSRVVLGFHYLGDVIVGIILGGIFILLVDRITQRDPRRGFALGIIVAIPALIISDGDPFGFIALGAALGGFAGSFYLGSIPELQSRAEGAILVFGGVLFLVAVVIIQQSIAPDNPIAITTANAIIIAGVLLAPAVSHRFETYRRQQMEVEESV